MDLKGERFVDYGFKNNSYKYNFQVLVLCFCATLYVFSTTFQREILYFLLHYIFLKPAY